MPSEPSVMMATTVVVSDSTEASVTTPTTTAVANAATRHSNGTAVLPLDDKKVVQSTIAKEALKENIKPHPMDYSPWLVSSDVVTGSTKTKEATIIRKSVITTQL